MAMNTRDYEPIGITKVKLEAFEEWAEQGLITPTQIDWTMNVCASIIKAMLRDQDPNSITGHMGKAEKHERLMRSIATLDRLHEAVKLNKRVNETL